MNMLAISKFGGMGEFNEFQLRKYFNLAHRMYPFMCHRQFEFLDFALYEVITKERSVWKEMERLGFKPVKGGPCKNSKWESNSMTVEFDEEEGMSIKIYYLNYRWAFPKFRGGYDDALQKMEEHFVRQIVDS